MPTKVRLFGPQSRALARGAVGDDVDGRSREGRFLRQAEQSLLNQLGGDLSFTQLALVRRAARLMLAAEMLDGRIGRGAEITAGEGATLGALNGALLEVLRELGAPPAQGT